MVIKASAFKGRTNELLKILSGYMKTITFSVTVLEFCHHWLIICLLICLNIMLRPLSHVPVISCLSCMNIELCYFASYGNRRPES